MRKNIIKTIGVIALLLLLALVARSVYVGMAYRPTLPEESNQITLP